MPKSPYCGCQFERGGGEDFRRNGGKITENRALTEVTRRYFGVDGGFSAVNRRSCRRLAAKKGPGNFTPNSQKIQCI